MICILGLRWCDFKFTTSLTWNINCLLNISARLSVSVSLYNYLLAFVAANLHITCWLYTGSHIWWTNAGHHWSCSLQYGSWWVTFGYSIRDLDPFNELQIFTCSASLCLPGMLSATLSHSCCFCFYVVACHSLAVSLATTWTWALPIRELLMIKFPGFPAGDTNELIAIWRLAIQLLQMKIL